MSTASYKRPGSRTLRGARGLSLVELMIAIAMGMVIVGALLALYINVTRTNNEMAKMNRQIENGRFAIQLLQDDLVHAGFWGSYVPHFDDLTAVTAPLDAPNALPDPCLAYASWDAAYISNLIGIPVQGYEAAPASCGVANQQANTDTLVVRHAQPCVAGVGTCEAEVAGKLYFQSTLCESEVSATAQQPNTDTTIKLNAAASDENDYYNGAVIRIVSGTGAGQSAKITAYDGTTKIATVSNVCVGNDCTTNPSKWTIIPDNASIYAFGLGYVLAKSGHFYHAMDCSTLAPKRKFVSNIYYIRDFAVTAGDGIPTLMRSTFDEAGGVLAHQPAQALIEGIQGFRVEYGVDSRSDTNAPVNYTTGVAWQDPLNKVSPTNRGDGIPESYVAPASLACASVSAGTTPDTCNAANVVAVRIHVLARALEPTPGYTDTKTYRLGDKVMGPFNDRFKRHVFSTTVRLVNPAGRRDTP